MELFSTSQDLAFTVVMVNNAPMRILNVLMAALVAVLSATQAAQADCVSDCQASTYCDGGSWECAHQLDSCYSRECHNSNNNDEQSSGGKYGAIAYDKKSEAFGLADESKDKSTAKKSALAYCGRYGDDCGIEETFSDTCAAIAQSTDGTVAWEVDDDRQDAVTTAVKRCNKKSDKEGCHIVLQHCYGNP